MNIFSLCSYVYLSYCTIPYKIGIKGCIEIDNIMPIGYNNSKLDEVLLQISEDEDIHQEAVCSSFRYNHIDDVWQGLVEYQEVEDLASCHVENESIFNLNFLSKYSIQEEEKSSTRYFLSKVIVCKSESNSFNFEINLEETAKQKILVLLEDICENYIKKIKEEMLTSNLLISELRKKMEIMHNKFLFFPNLEKCVDYIRQSFKTLSKFDDDSSLKKLLYFKDFLLFGNKGNFTFEKEHVPTLFRILRDLKNCLNCLISVVSNQPIVFENLNYELKSYVRIHKVVFIKLMDEEGVKLEGIDILKSNLNILITNSRGENVSLDVLNFIILENTLCLTYETLEEYEIYSIEITIDGRSTNKIEMLWHYDSSSTSE